MPKLIIYSSQWLTIIIELISVLAIHSIVTHLLSINESLSLLISILLDQLNHCVYEHSNADNRQEERESSQENKDPVEEVEALKFHFAVGSLRE